MSGRTILSGAFLILLGAAAAWWVFTLPPAGSAKPSAHPLPANVPKVFKEDQANVVTLTAEAVKSLNVKTAKVEWKKVRQSRVYGGEVMVPAGQTIQVSAPLCGTLAAANGFPKPGMHVKKGDPIFLLSPLLTPEGKVTLATARVDTKGQVETAQTNYDAAKQVLDRAKRLYKSDAGTRSRMEDAQAAHDVAKKNLEAAQARLETLEKIASESDKGRAAPLTIESPDTGILRNVTVLHGQNVPSGALLFEVVNLDRVWVRVPVYVGDLSNVDAHADVDVAGLTARTGSQGELARPCAAPPSANPTAGTVDLFYAMDNKPAYSPGQRVGVTLTLKGEEESLTVPWSAVVFDVYGGAWVYERTGETTFARRRVVVQFVRGDTAVLRSGPKEGTPVVIAEKAKGDGKATSGPAELFGAETGFSK